MRDRVEAAGKRTDLIAAHLMHEVVTPLVAGTGRLTLALDDTPTARSRLPVPGDPPRGAQRRLR